MLSGVLILAVIVLGFCIMLGVKAEKLNKLVLWLIVAPLFIDVAYISSIWAWQCAPLWMQILSALLIPFFILALLKMVLPTAKWLQTLQELFFQTLIYAVTFPFRFLWRAGRFLLQRERRAVQLNPHRPAVGNRPPIINGRDRRENQNNLFD